jgi:hypothetical protein
MADQLTEEQIAGEFFSKEKFIKYEIMSLLESMSLYN